MTKLTQTTLNTLFKTGAPTTKAVLFYGQDEGFVNECRMRLTEAVVPDKDPFRLVELTPAKIKDDPSLLSAEANALSLMGGRRVITVRGADNHFTAVLKDFLPSYTGDALIIVTAASLKTKDSLPILFADSPDLAVFPCYSDEGEALKRFVFQSVSEQGFETTPDVINFISDNLGADRLQSRSELAKLFAYMGNEKKITMEDATACIGDASALSIDQMLYALSGGRQKEMNETLDRLFAEGESPIGLLRAVSAHFKKFHVTLARIADGTSIEAAIIPLRLHFKRVDEFKAQLRQWNLAKVGRVLDLLVQAEQSCKFAARPQQLTVARVFLQIAAQATHR